MESFTSDPARPEVVHETAGFNLVSRLTGLQDANPVNSLLNPLQWLSIGGFQLVGDAFGWSGFRLFQNLQILKGVAWGGVAGQVLFDESATCLLSRSLGGGALFSGETLLDLGSSLLVRTLLTQMSRSLATQPLARFLLVPLFFGALSALQDSIRGNGIDSAGSLGRHLLGVWAMMIQGSLLMKGRSIVSHRWSQGHSPDLVGWRVKETHSDTHRTVCYVSRDQGPKRVGAILRFLQSNPFDPEDRHYEFEIEGEIAAAELKSLTRLPYEVCLTERNSRLVLITGLFSATPNIDRHHYSRTRSSWLSLHTHPIGDSWAGTEGPSIKDIIEHSPGVDSGTPLLVVHHRGITLYRKPYWDSTLGTFALDKGRALFDRYRRAFGLDEHRNPNNSFFPFIHLTLSEGGRFVRQYAEDSGVMIQEAEWGDEAGISRMMELINLRRPYEPPPLTPRGTRDFFHLPLDLPTRERALTMRSQDLGRWLAQLPPDRMHRYLDESGILIGNPPYFQSAYAIERWLLIGNDAAATEGLPKLLDDHLPVLTGPLLQKGSLFDFLVPDLTVKSSRLEPALTLLRRPTFQAYLRDRYGFDLKDGHPRSLEELIRLHPETRSLDKYPSPTPEEQESFSLLQKLGLANPVYQGNPFVDFMFARRMVRDGGSYDKIRVLSDYLMARPISTPDDAENPYTLLKELYPKTGDLWRQLGMEEAFCTAFPDPSLFWRSDKTFWQVYRELKSAA